MNASQLFVLMCEVCSKLEGRSMAFTVNSLAIERKRPIDFQPDRMKFRGSLIGARENGSLTDSGSECVIDLNILRLSDTRSLRMTDNKND